MSNEEPSGSQLLGKLAEITLTLSRILERIEMRNDSVPMSCQSNLEGVQIYEQETKDNNG